jgi:hypothetical protein
MPKEILNLDYLKQWSRLFLIDIKSIFEIKKVKYMENP